MWEREDWLFVAKAWAVGFAITEAIGIALYFTTK